MLSSKVILKESRMFKKLFRRKPDHEVFVTEGGDRQIDLYPIAEDVLAKAPAPCGMDALRLAELAQISFNGGYIRVSEYPEEVDRDYAKLVVDRVIRWARWQRKAEGFKRTSFKTFTIHTGKSPCTRMAGRNSEQIEKDNIERLPLDDCWQRCSCRYEILLKRNR